MTGTLTLDAQNNPNAFFDFEIGSTLITASDAVVNVINATAGTGVFWQVGSSATLGTGTTFAGNILALASITLDTGASITCGRALAQTGSVTLDANAISDNCSANALGSGRTDAGSVGFDGSGVGPEPGTVPLLGTGLLALALYGWRLRNWAAQGHRYRGSGIGAFGSIAVRRAGGSRRHPQPGVFSRGSGSIP